MSDLGYKPRNNLFTVSKSSKALSPQSKPLFKKKSQPFVRKSGSRGSRNVMVAQQKMSAKEVLRQEKTDTREFKSSTPRPGKLEFERVSPKTPPPHPKLPLVLSKYAGSGSAGTPNQNSVTPLDVTHNRGRSTLGLVKPRPLLNYMQQSSADQEKMTGIRNLGNSCYMNAVLQQLAGIKGFRQGINHVRRYLSGMNTANSDTVYATLGEVLDEVIRARRARDDGKAGEISPVNPSKLKIALSKHSQQFSNNSQQDAHELFSECLNWIEDEVKEAVAKADEKDLIHQICPVQSTFGCTIKHTWVCRECHHQSTATEPFNDFSLDIPQSSSGPVSLNRLLQNFLQEEEVEKKCDSCSGASATVSHKIVNAPKVLVMHLKRFKPNFVTQTYDKLSTGVLIEERFNISDMCEGSEGQGREAYDYDLQGVVSHMGSSIFAGHYVSDVFDEDIRKWHNYNDSVVEEIEFQKLRSQQRQEAAYMLFFQLRSKKPFNSRFPLAGVQSARKEKE